MARPPKKQPEFTEPDLNEEQMAEDMQKVNELALLNSQAQDNANAVAQQLGYEGALTVGALEDEIRFFQRRTAEACLELGKRLLLLKELTLHGEFEQRIGLLGFAPRAAQKFMQAAFKFSKSANLALLSEKIGTQSKLLELVTLDDEELAELSDGGTVRGMQLDDIETMTYSELKSALREERLNKAAQARISAEKSALIDDLKMKAYPQKVALTDWPEQFTGYIAQVQEAHRAIKAKLGALDIIREEAMKLEPAPGEEAALERARKMLADEMVVIHNQCADYISAIGLSFDKTLGAFTDARVDLFKLPGV